EEESLALISRVADKIARSRPRPGSPACHPSRQAGAFPGPDQSPADLTKLLRVRAAEQPHPLPPEPGPDLEQSGLQQATRLDPRQVVEFGHWVAVAGRFKVRGRDGRPVPLVEDGRSAEGNETATPSWG